MTADRLDLFADGESGVAVWERAGEWIERRVHERTWPMHVRVRSKPATWDGEDFRPSVTLDGAIAQHIDVARAVASIVRDVCSGAPDPPLDTWWLPLAYMSEADDDDLTSEIGIYSSVWLPWFVQAAELVNPWEPDTTAAANTVDDTELLAFQCARAFHDLFDRCTAAESFECPRELAAAMSAAEQHLVLALAPTWTGTTRELVDTARNIESLSA